MGDTEGQLILAELSERRTGTLPMPSHRANSSVVPVVLPFFSQLGAQGGGGLGVHGAAGGVEDDAVLAAGVLGVELLVEHVVEDAGRIAVERVAEAAGPGHDVVEQVAALDR